MKWYVRRMNTPPNQPDQPNKSAGNPSRNTSKPRKTTKGQRFHKTIDSPAVQEFARQYAMTNNGAASVRAAFPGKEYTPGSTWTKANTLLRNVQVQDSIEEQRRKLEALGSKSIARVDRLIDSDDENVAGQNSRFVIEQTHGKATQRVQHSGLFATVTYDLSGGQAGAVPQAVLDQLEKGKADK